MSKRPPIAKVGGLFFVLLQINLFEFGYIHIVRIGKKNIHQVKAVLSNIIVIPQKSCQAALGDYF